MSEVNIGLYTKLMYKKNDIKSNETKKESLEKPTFSLKKPTINYDINIIENSVIKTFVNKNTIGLVIIISFTLLCFYLFINNQNLYLPFIFIVLIVFSFLINSFLKCSNQKLHNVELQRIYKKDLEFFNKKLVEHNNELKKYWKTKEELTVKINIIKKSFKEEVESALGKKNNYVDFLKIIKTIEIFTRPPKKYYQKLEKLKLIKENNNLKYRLLIRLDICLDYNKYLLELYKVKEFFNENDFDLDKKYVKKIEYLKLKTLDETFYNKFYHLKIKNKSFEEEDLKKENNLFKIFAKNNYEENPTYNAELKAYLFYKEFKYHSLIRSIKELKVKIDNNYYDNWEGLEDLFRCSTTKEIDVLNKMLNNKETKNSVELINQIKKTSVIKFIGDKSISYYEVLKNCSNFLEIETTDNSISDIEQKIVQKQMNLIVSKLSVEEQKELEIKLIEYSSTNNYGKELITLGTLTGAQLSGFGIYLAASTIVGGLTSLLGVALPFAFYTGMSTVISTIIGPVGWLGLAGFTLYKFSKIDYEKLLTIIVYIIYLKYKLKINIENSNTHPTLL